MANMIGSESKSRLTERVLDRIEIRTSAIFAQAMTTLLDEMGPDAKVSSDAYQQTYLLAWQVALMEEQVADIKTIRDSQKEEK